MLESGFWSISIGHDSGLIPMRGNLPRITRKVCIEVQKMNHRDIKWNDLFKWKFLWQRDLVDFKICSGQCDQVGQKLMYHVLHCKVYSVNIRRYDITDSRVFPFSSRWCIKNGVDWGISKCSIFIQLKSIVLLQEFRICVPNFHFFSRESRNLDFNRYKF